MKRIIIILFCFNIVWGQEKPVSHQFANLTCKTCHSCEVPTKNNPCLIECPKELISSNKFLPSAGPDVMVLERLEKGNDKYVPVIFSHRLHAEMAYMSDNCETCHHYNPPGKVMVCSSCHSAERMRDDKNIPDLLGSYHLQCMGCHKLFEDDPKCQSCHHLKSSVTESVKKINVQKSKKTHQMLDIPAVTVYKTPKAPQKLVTFNHKDHSGVFKISCKSCHGNESCAKCHSKNEQMMLSMVDKDYHKKCSNCHDTDKRCSSCHLNQKTEEFEHKRSTGFDLDRFHRKLKCEDCHVTINKFKGLDKKCVSCHKDWSTDNFMHGVTGLKLDELHSDFECNMCHEDFNYTVNNCGNCHEEEYKYPNKKPGIIIKK